MLEAAHGARLEERYETAKAERDRLDSEGSRTRKHLDKLRAQLNQAEAEFAATFHEPPVISANASAPASTASLRTSPQLACASANRVDER